ncbi:hypothetical protein F5B19DRAFT_498183 [Rostrohypoxylon terebratum]|nr:hypothetical protein F5B19DRAFT_498183 [Rostrohypoxylon terebratum]
MDSKDPEPDSKKPGADKAEPDNVSRKLPWWDMSIKREQVKKVCTKAENYKIGLERQSIEIKTHLALLGILGGALNRFEVGFKEINGKITKSCKTELKLLKDSMDKFQEMRQNMEELAIHYEKERDEAIEDIKAKGPAPSTPLRLSPQDLTNLGLDDLNKFIKDELTRHVLSTKDRKAVEAIQKQLLIERQNLLPPLEKIPVERQPADSLLLPPIRAWMRPNQKRRQMRKRIVAMAKFHPKPKPRVIERTTPRIEMKKKKLDMLKPSRQHRRERNKTLIVGEMFMYRLMAEEANSRYYRGVVTRDPFVFACFLRTYDVENTGNWHHPLDDLIDNIKSFKFNYKWPWGCRKN